MEAFVNELTQRAARMGIPLTQGQSEAFYTYYEMLKEANARFNLTRVADNAEDFIDRNLLDSLAPILSERLSGVHTLIDVGTGAGFPGLPIAIARPDIRVTLLDALDKRVQFLRSIVDTLQLNAEVLHGRAEDLARRAGYRERCDVACARAVASVNVLGEYLLPFVRPEGWMLALKGPGLEDELAAAGNALEILGGGERCIEEAPIPGREWQHRLLWVRKSRPTPEKYPRRSGMPEKRPL